MAVGLLRGRPMRWILCVLTCHALVVSGCASGAEVREPQVPKVPVARVDTIAARLPPAIASSRTLTVAVNVPYRPSAYRDHDGKLVGFELDLMDAVAAVLGIRAEYAATAFEKIIPAVRAGSYDVGMSAIADSRDREERVDLVTYFAAGVQWAQRTAAPVDPNNPCGKRVAVQMSSVEHIEKIPGKSARCVAEGKPAIGLVPFDDQSAATRALVRGQVDAFAADSAAIGFAIRFAEGKLEPAGPVFDPEPHGWAVAKGSPLAPVLRRAMQHLIDSGAYRRITENWGVQEGAISTSVVNGASG